MFRELLHESLDALLTDCDKAGLTLELFDGAVANTIPEPEMPLQETKTFFEKMSKRCHFPVDIWTIRVIITVVIEVYSESVVSWPFLNANTATPEPARDVPINIKRLFNGRTARNVAKAFRRMSSVRNAVIIWAGRSLCRKSNRFYGN